MALLGVYDVMGVLVSVPVTNAAPVITVSGTATTTIEVGDTAPTFTASTDDGSSVTVGGDVVNTSVAGTYSITFNSIDQAGNRAVQVIRVVTVLPEVISNAFTASIISNSTSYSAGEIIKLEAVVNNPNQDETYTYTWSTGETGSSLELISPVIMELTNITRSVTISSSLFTTTANITVVAEETDIAYLQAEGLKDIFYKNIDEIFGVSIEVFKDSNENSIFKSLENYDNAEYYITTTAGAKIVTLVKDKGITILNDTFIIFVPNSELNFTGVFKHYLVGISNGRRELLFDRNLIIENM